MQDVPKFSKHYIELFIPFQYSVKWIQEILQQHDGDYSECVMRIALVAWVDHRAGMQCPFTPLFQSIYCTVLMKNSAAYSQLSTALCG